jgi:hypothetical protein
MAKKKEDDCTSYKRELTEIHVTLGMVRAAIQALDNAVESKDKEAFRDALNKLKVYVR